MTAPVEGSSSANSTTASRGSLFQLISVGLLFVSFIFLIVSAATTGWIVVGSTNIGLFTVCGGGYCGSTLNAFANQSSCQSRDQAAQAFIVLAILTIFPLLCIVAIRRFIGHTEVGALVNKYIPWWIDVITAAVIVFFLTITWGAVANYYTDCVCNNVGSTACGLNYGVLLFLARDENNEVKPVHTHQPPHQQSSNLDNTQPDAAHAA
ncbi:membrane-associated protein, putative [Bodo saltans]|uniref:Membrane-associated protein, putative n=1 Tax=Bodo saltans TaxID=75058 RepID=A0A0S4J8D7_BODSA|nr:membrane-associated protein, putative [Bodo saltans]|eukprot:CUG68014.1 membrane-associated protein, putative [Bodo saltans]